jgi:hypothetical protein
MTTPIENSIVLFLDFDGVSHPEPCLKSQLFCFMTRIEDVLREHPMIEIVISSSWRDEFSLEQLRDFFASDMRARVVGITPSIKNPSSTWLPGQVPEFEREWEIETWMKANRSWDTPWLAIDDRHYWFRPNSANLLRTNALDGFTLDDQVTLRTMLLDRL